ncbi:MAG: DUF3999 domain-containing protein [Pseudomonadota bacterium]
MKFIRRLIIQFCVSLVAAGAAFSQTLPEFNMRAPIELKGGGPYYQLALPLDIYFASHFTDLHDLRVFNAQGEVVPFSVIHGQSRSEQSVEKIDLKWFPLYSRTETTAERMPEIHVTRNAAGTVVSVMEGQKESEKGGKLRGYLFDTSQYKNAFQTLSLNWDASISGFQQLSVEVSDDLKQWRTWQGAAQLARLEYNGQRIERKDIELTGERANYLRLQWREPDQAPALRSAILTTSASIYQSAPFVWSTPFAPSRSDNSEYEYQLARSVPVERIRITVPQINVLAPVEIWGKSEANSPWHRLTQTVVYRLQVDGKEWPQQDIWLSGQPVRYLKLKADARGGGLGQGAPMLSIGLTSKQLLFLARGQAPFVLATGHDLAKGADLSVTTLVPGYGTSNALPVSTAGLGVLSAQSIDGKAAVATKKTVFDEINWKTVILWAILLTGVMAMAIMAVRLLKKTQ